MILHSLHCISLSTTCLAICKASDYTAIEQKIYLWLNRAFIKAFSRLLLIEGVVHLKPLILYILCYSINSVFAFMNYNCRVCTRYTINLSVYQFRLKKRSFSDTNITLSSLSHRRIMFSHLNHLFLLFVNQHLELYITPYSICFIESSLFFSFMLYLFHFTSPFFSVISELLYC